MIDCHTHLQPHGEKPPMTRERIEAYVRAGEANRVTTIAITEHLFRFQEAYELLDGWWENDPDPALRELAQRYWGDHVSGSIADYVRVVEQAKSAGLPVVLGLEMDWLHGRADQLAQILAPYDWDIVLGSVHYIGAWGFDSVAAEWTKRDVAGVWRQYGSLVRDLGESGLADVIAHPDLAKVFGHRPADESTLHDAILSGATNHGAAIELNSAGLRKPCHEIYPALPLLERAQALGLSITLASDAHTPERVGENFGDLVALAHTAGYSRAVSFAGRKAQPYALPSAPST